MPFDSDLDWSTLGAVPEMLQTAHGSLTIGLDAQLAAYGGDASDLPPAVLHSFLDAVADGRATVPVHASFTLDEILTPTD